MFFTAHAVARPIRKRIRKHKYSLTHTRNDIRFLSWRRCSSPIFLLATGFRGACVHEQQDVYCIWQYCGCVKASQLYPLDDMNIWLRKRNKRIFSLFFIIFHAHPWKKWRKKRKEKRLGKVKMFDKIQVNRVLHNNSTQPPKMIECILLSRYARVDLNSNKFLSSQSDRVK